LAATQKTIIVIVVKGIDKRWHLKCQVPCPLLECEIRWNTKEGNRYCGWPLLNYYYSQVIVGFAHQNCCGTWIIKQDCKISKELWCCKVIAGFGM